MNDQECSHYSALAESLDWEVECKKISIERLHEIINNGSGVFISRNLIGKCAAEIASREQSENRKQDKFNKKILFWARIAGWGTIVSVLVSLL